MKTFARVASWLVALTALGAATVVGSGWLLPHSMPGYLLRQGLYQAEMLWYRVPLAEALDGHAQDATDRAVAEVQTAGARLERPYVALTSEQLERLSLVPRIKAFGASLGLAASAHYETINPTWQHVVWNVSACDELAFRPVRWRFPVVGTVPYLGYFNRDEALAQARRLSARGLDVHVRTAGAYSSLGWYAMPVLPNMLAWTEYQLADTLLHEITHATLWVPGSVQFNESFASFVGEQAALRYLSDRYGPDALEVREVLTRRADGELFRAMLRDVFAELDAIYRSPGLAPSDKRHRKHLVIAGLPTRAARLGLSEPERWIAHLRRGSWNNATLMGFRRYNRSHEWFEVLLAEEGGDLRAFVDRVARLTADEPDPFAAIARAVGAEPPEDEDLR